MKPAAHPTHPQPLAMPTLGGANAADLPRKAGFDGLTGWARWKARSHVGGVRPCSWLQPVLALEHEVQPAGQQDHEQRPR